MLLLLWENKQNWWVHYYTFMRASYSMHERWWHFEYCAHDAYSDQNGLNNTWTHAYTYCSSSLSLGALLNSLSFPALTCFQGESPFICRRQVAKSCWDLILNLFGCATQFNKGSLQPLLSYSSWGKIKRKKKKKRAYVKCFNVWRKNIWKEKWKIGFGN